MSIFRSIRKLFRQEEEYGDLCSFEFEKDIIRDSKRERSRGSYQFAVSTFRSNHQSVMAKIRARDKVFLRTFDREELTGPDMVMSWSSFIGHDYLQEEFDIWAKLIEKEITEEQTIEMMTDLMELYYGKKYSPDSEIDTVEDSDSSFGYSSSDMDSPRVDTIENSHGRFGYSESNPIPVAHMSGEIDYLSTLRCSCNMPFAFYRIGSFGSGPDGHIIDGYELFCRTGKHKVVLYMDMYHSGQSELIPEGLTKGEPKGFCLPNAIPGDLRTQLNDEFSMERVKTGRGDMNLRELLNSFFDFDLLISGGIGNSRDNPIVIHQSESHDYIYVESTITIFLGILRGIVWEWVTHSFIEHNGRTLDQWTIETEETREDEVITRTENYYFDITECLDSMPESNEEAEDTPLPSGSLDESELNNMNLRQLLKTDFDIDFPISGGTGNSRDNPIVIHREEPNDYVSVEHGILRCLGIGKGIEWELIENNIFRHNDRILDKVRIETKETYESKVIREIEAYYFDITECVDSIPGSNGETDHDYPSSDKISSNQNIKLIDNEAGVYCVLDLVTIRLPGPWFWQFMDLEEQKGKGSLFGAYDEKGERMLASIIVIDVTGDETEPDISTIAHADVPTVDNFLEEFNRKVFAAAGQELIQWIPSQLDQSEDGKRLVNEYIVRNQDLDRQYITVRFKAKDRKIKAVGCYDVVEGEILASQITGAVREVAVFDLEEQSARDMDRAFEEALKEDD